MYLPILFYRKIVSTEIKKKIVVTNLCHIKLYNIHTFIIIYKQIIVDIYVVLIMYTMFILSVLYDLKVYSVIIFYCSNKIKIKTTITVSKVTLHPKKGCYCIRCVPRSTGPRQSQDPRRIETPGYSNPRKTRSWDDGCCVYKTGLASRWTLESHIDLLHIKPKTVGRPMGKNKYFYNHANRMSSTNIIKGKRTMMNLINDSMVSYRF